MKEKSPLEITELIMKEIFVSTNLLYAWHSVGTVKQVSILNRIKDIIAEVYKDA